MAGFAGKVAFVTGGGNGIGAAVSTQLAREGAFVFLTDRDEAAAAAVASGLSGQGFQVQHSMLDVTDFAATQALVASLEGKSGGIDILVNSAGVNRGTSFLDMSQAEWERVLSINLTGTFLSCRAVLPGMVERGRGRIVNMGSLMSKIGHPGYAHYVASKFGILGLTQTIAAEFAALGITANCVIPGIVETQMWNGPEGSVKTTFASAEEAQAYVQANIPLRRTQSPEDVAEMVAFLVSDKARNVTGGSFHVDGGMLPR